MIELAKARIDFTHVSQDSSQKPGMAVQAQGRVLVQVEDIYQGENNGLFK